MMKIRKYVYVLKIRFLKNTCFIFELFFQTKERYTLFFCSHVIRQRLYKSYTFIYAHDSRPSNATIKYLNLTVVIDMLNKINNEHC